MCKIIDENHANTPPPPKKVITSLVLIWALRVRAMAARIENILLKIFWTLTEPIY